MRTVKCHFEQSCQSSLFDCFGSEARSTGPGTRSRSTSRSYSMALRAPENTAKALTL